MAKGKIQIDPGTGEPGRLKALMRELGLTQAEVAGRLGTSQATISKILAGRQRPRPALTAAIDRAVGRTEPIDHDALIARAAAATRRSPAFRAILAAALELANIDE